MVKPNDPDRERGGVATAGERAAVETPADHRQGRSATKSLLVPPLSRRRFLQLSGGASAAAGWGGAGLAGFFTLSEAQAPPASSSGSTKISKNVCHQCPARCGIDVYTTDGRVHAIYGAMNSPVSNGKLCPKGHLGAYILYDPDRFKGPMKRTNPKKGRHEDPRFIPISWDEALGTVAQRLQALRDRGESHRFALLFGRGWGATDAGLLGDFGKLYGSPNVGINHSSMCSDGSKKAKQATDGNYSYNAYDYRNTNYLLIFGASFLEAFRPYNYLMQMWGHMRSKSPKTRVTAVDVHLNTTLAAADRALYVKPGTDAALALAIAHLMLTEGWWAKDFVGDFVDGENLFRTGVPVDSQAFKEKWTHGLIDWWNHELKDRTPRWAAQVTTIAETDIVAVAREFGTTRPAIALFERGPTTHSNGVYAGMCIHALNALAGSMFARGGLMYQLGPPYGPPPVKVDDYMDEYAASDERKRFPRVDMARTEKWPMASNMLQEVARNHNAGSPYKLDTVMFYLTNPTYSAPDARGWEAMLKEVFVIETSPFPSETAMLADLILPDHTYLERLQCVDPYPFEGWPLASLRTPAIAPLYDTKVFGDQLIEIGKRLSGKMAGYYRALDSTENLLRHLAKGFETHPGTNGVDGYESWVKEGVWYQKPYLWQQRGGEFYEWDGKGYDKPMTPQQVKEKLFKTASGKFELDSAYLQRHAAYIAQALGIAEARVGYPQFLPPRYIGQGDLHFVTPKLAMHAEGRGANIPAAIALVQPVMGGRGTVYLEMHPETARRRGIRNGDKVRIRSELGAIEAYCRWAPGCRPDTVVLPIEYGHWAQGRWARGRLPGNSLEITANRSDPIAGLASFYSTKVTVERA